MLVELHKRAAFRAGLAVVGTLCYMTWLNELGARAVLLRTEDVDLARRQRLELPAPLGFLEAMEATKLPFSPVPACRARSRPRPSNSPEAMACVSTGLLLAGTSASRCLCPNLHWHAQAIPHYDYLLASPREAAILAGGHCIPVRLPSPERLVWHKLYSGATRTGAPEKAAKDLLQAATLAALLVEQEDEPLADSGQDAPSAFRAAGRKRLPAMRRLLVAHPQAMEQIELCLA